MSTTVNYPGDRLGLPTIGGYGIEPQEGVARTDMDTGPARQRRRWRGAPTTFPVQFKYTRLQLAVFEGWYFNLADEGAAWFNITLLSGMGLVDHEARFKGAYKAAPWNGSSDPNAEWWRVTATLEVRNRPVLSALMTTMFIESDPAAFFATVGAFTHLVELEFPATTGDELLGLQTAVAAFTHLVEHEFPT